MGESKRILSAKPGTISIDKYGGGEFTVEEVAAMEAPMVLTDDAEEIDRFCERFAAKRARDGGEERLN